MTLWTVAHQAPLSMTFSRQEYWSRLSFPIPGDLSYLGIELTSLMFPAFPGKFFIIAAPGKPKWALISRNLDSVEEKRDSKIIEKDSQY